MDAAKVAMVGYRALKKKRVMVIPGLLFSSMITSYRLMPRKAVTGVIGYLDANP